MDKPTRRRSDAKRTALSDDNPHPTSVDREQIAHRAFELFCARGCQDGHDLDDWLRAERELRMSDTVRGAALEAPLVPSTDSDTQPSRGTQRQERIQQSRPAQAQPEL
jgi:Protein of unknown function (DUF2934)